MRDILKRFDSVGKKPLKESKLAECGMDMPSSPKTPMSINISGDAGDIASMLKTLSGMESGSSMSMPPMGGSAMSAQSSMPSGALSSLIGREETDEVDDGDFGDATSAPDEEYSDVDTMVNKLSGGINGKKKMYKPAAKGDNPMAAESIKQRLWAALNEKKAKPDFLDMDKDGNKKEPMKKAVADKKGAAPKKGQVPPQFAKKK